MRLNTEKRLIVLNKKEGETPLEALEKWRKKNPKYKDAPMTYAGRLDPMASGILLILVGEETKKKEEYLALDKEYEFSVLFGFFTDTYDILGKVITKKVPYTLKKELEGKIKKEIVGFLGKSMQKYPMYSSKTVKGIPLFLYARENKRVKVPKKEIFISSIDLKNIKEIIGEKLFLNIEKRVKKVKGDFRQGEILKIWRRKLKNEKERKFLIASFKIKCGSGTYVRAIAQGIGEKIKIPSIAFSIKRTRVGKYKIR